jgi:DNA-binding PadR family transcriptional regulator
MKAEALKGHLDGLVLAIVADEPAHGYVVIEELKRRSGGTFDLPEGTVYPVLHRLEVDGLLTSTWTSAAGRRRRVYRVTKRGRAVLSERKREWHSFAAAVDAVLA